MSRVSVVGAGYVGLVTAACLADLGHQVVCVERDPVRVAAIEAGRPVIHEHGLPEMLGRTLGHSLEVTGDLDRAVRGTDLTFVAVGTPSTADGIDLSFVLGAVDEIGQTLRDKTERHTVVIKSTVVPGTTDTVVRAALEAAAGRPVGPDLGLAVNPEFLTEGRAVADFMDPDRIVIGADAPSTADALRAVYAGFPEVPVVVVSMREAEMVKYASNALLATMISFSNEIANLGAALGGVDMVAVMRGLHESRYLTTRLDDGPVTAEVASFLFAGCGFGGSCLPKDVTALVAQARSIGVPARVLESVLAVNAAQPAIVVDLVRQGLDGLAGRTVGVLGLAFKPDTNDTRESPAFPIIDALVTGGARVKAHDPLVVDADLPPEVSARIERVDDLERLVGEADALVIVTSWSLYEQLPEIIHRLGTEPLVVDGRRMLAPTSVPRYAGTGW